MPIEYKLLYSPGYSVTAQGRMRPSEGGAHFLLVIIGKNALHAYTP